MNLTYPAIFLNCKTYEESSGEKGVKLAKIADKIAKEYNASIIIIPQHPILAKVVESVDIPVFAQSVDAIAPGSHTGWITPLSVASIGVLGTLINHSEHRDTIANIEEAISLCKKNNLYTLVCSNNIATSIATAACNPDAIAMEPPELIGSGISVSTKPEIVENTIKSVKKHFPSVHVVVGAGVSTKGDVRDSLKLNAEGVLLASAFVKAKNPEELLKSMVESIIN
ncbi:MAG: triose-phosphate isomerase [Candidatus Thorarchaeota archaeon]